MTKKEAEDYRYGYEHAAELIVLMPVRVRKASNCGGWIDLDTLEVYPNERIESAKIGDRISKEELKGY